MLLSAHDEIFCIRCPSEMWGKWLAVRARSDSLCLIGGQSATRTRSGRAIYGVGVDWLIRRDRRSDCLIEYILSGRFGESSADPRTFRYEVEW